MKCENLDEKILHYSLKTKICSQKRIVFLIRVDYKLSFQKESSPLVNDNEGKRCVRNAVSFPRTTLTDSEYPSVVSDFD